LPYPGGPAIAQRALRGDPKKYKLPLALMGQGNLNFSYAGLKTAVLYQLHHITRRSPRIINNFAASFQQAAVEQLVTKTRWALQKSRAKTLLLAGGVAANLLLRQRLTSMANKDFPGIRYFQPPLPLCMDNGVMIAMAGTFRAAKRDFTPWQKIKADPNWELP